MPKTTRDKSLRVGRAKTGLGLFAAKPIKKGKPIIYYVGPLLDTRNKEDDSVTNKYLFEINTRWTIDGSVRKNIARYINHGCRPNAEAEILTRAKKVLIRAKRDIEAGEEINYHYGQSYFKHYLKPLGCKCTACLAKRVDGDTDASDVA